MVSRLTLVPWVQILALSLIGHVGKNTVEAGHLAELRTNPSSVDDLLLNCWHVTFVFSLIHICL